MFRIDVREDTRPFIEGMVRILRGSGLKIALRDERLLEPAPDLFTRIGAASNAG